jgi:hypothetical protein
MAIRFRISFDGFENTSAVLATARQVAAVGAQSRWPSTWARRAISPVSAYKE